MWTGLISFPFIFYWQQKDRNDHFNSQLTQTTGAQACIMYLDAFNYVVTSMISFFIPALVLVIMYWKVYRKASAKAKQLKNNSITLTDMIQNKNLKEGTSRKVANSKSRDTSSRDLKEGMINRKMMREYKAAMVVGVVVTAFVICWTPFFTHNVIKIFCSKCILNPALTSPILLWLGYFNSCLNPFIYVISNDKFRQAFFELYWCK